METVAVPPEVIATLRAAGYTLRGPAGVGSGGPVWAATGPTVGGGEGAGGTGGVGGGVDGARVVVHAVTVPPGAAGVAVGERLDALCGLEHPHLARVADVLVVQPAGRAIPAAHDLLVLVEEVPGTTLAALLAARGPLTPGEAVTLAVPLAGALDALHRAGLVHGDVSPGNVVVTTEGRPVLIDVLGTLDGATTRGGRGTPGFVAPERAAVRTGTGRAGAGPARGAPTAGGRAGGDPHDGGTPGPSAPAGAPADVFGLATVARTALDPAQADGPLGQELAAACAPDPVLRPTAGELAAGCWARATAAPIALPDPGVLARTALAQLAGEQRTVSVDRRSRHRAARPRRWASRRARTALGSAVVALGATALAGSGMVPGGTGSEDGRAGPPAVSSGGGPVAGAGAPVDPLAAAVALTERRAQALAGADPAALDAVAREGGPAHAADLALMERLTADGVRLEGLAATDVAAVPVGVRAGGPVRPGTPVDVAVTSGVAAHRRHAPEGVVDVGAQPARTVVLTLVWTDEGWRVESVRAAA